MENEHEIGSPENLASFSERAIAFSIDYALFAAGHVLSLGLFLPDPDAHQRGIWFVLWAALFLAYQAVFSSGGRVSLGKALLGLRVVDRRGEPLSAVAAIWRSLMYIASSLLCLGFALPLLTSLRQAWHDLVVGSLVVRRDQPRLAPALARAGALACLAAFAGVWVWNQILPVRNYRLARQAEAQKGLSEMASLETIYHAQNGEYAKNIFALASVSPAPTAFLNDAAEHYDVAGIDFRVTPDGYTISARARDALRTPVTISGS